MREFKVDPKTGKVLYKIQPEGLPAIWIEDDLCCRCKSYGKCLGLKSLEDAVWRELSLLLNTAELDIELVGRFKEKFNVDLSPLIEKELCISTTEFGTQNECSINH